MSDYSQEKGSKHTTVIEKSNCHSALDINQRTRETLLLTFSAVGTVSLLGLALWYCRYGIELSDEGFHLIWISNPFIYSASIPPTQFGFIYHPLYVLLGGNIAALRQANILITYLLAWVLTHTLLSTTIPKYLTLSAPCDEKFHLKHFILSAGFAAASLSSIVHQGAWFPTLSYNTLAFQSLLITATGMLLAGKKTSTITLSGWTIIGIGGWLAFMAKPTTAAALVIVVILYLFASNKFRFRLLLVSIAAAAGLIILSALMIDGSVVGFINRLQTSYERTRSLCNGYSILLTLLKFAAFPIHSVRSIIFYLMVAAILIAAFYSRRTLLKFIALSALAAVILIVILGTMYGGNIGGEKIRFFLTTVFCFFLMLAVPFAVVCFAFNNRGKRLSLLSPGEWVTTLCFFVFPLIFSFGSSGDYWYRGCSAGLFWTLSALFLLIIVSRADFKTLLPFNIATVIVMAVVLLNSLVSPQRQPFKLWQYNYPVKIGGSTLILASSFGKYVERAINSAQNAGFKKGTPVIDLTGLTPGIPYAIGATIIGQAWNEGGLEGSDRVAVEFLKKVSPEQIAASWLIVEPAGPYPVSPSYVLASFGADLGRDYEVAASWSTPVNDFFGSRVQELLRPVRPLSKAIAACETARKQKE